MAKMSNWNLDGKKPQITVQRHYLPAEADGVPIVYEGKIKDISDIYKTKKLDADAEEDRIVLTVGVTSTISGNTTDIIDEKEISCYMNFVVSKGSGAYSNSRLYDVLETADLLKRAEGVASAANEQQLTFLREELIGKKVRVLLKTAKKGQPDQYSVVKKIVKIFGE